MKQNVNREENYNKCPGKIVTMNQKTNNVVKVKSKSSVTMYKTVTMWQKIVTVKIQQQ